MIWQDRTRTDPTKRKFIDENGNEQNVNIEEIQSNITQSGTPVNATTMNNIEKNLGTYGNDSYDSTATYLEGDVVTHNALLYRAKQDIDTAEEWTAEHWEETSALGELSRTSGNEIAYGLDNITRQSKAVVYPTNYRTVNQEVNIGATNPNNIKTWFKQGKNLMGSPLELGTYSDVGLRSASTANYRNVTPIAVQPNTTYTFSINGVSQKYAVYYYDSLMTFISAEGLTTGTFTTPANCYYINFRCFNADYTSDFANLKLQLELGSSATSYEAYITPEIIIDKNLIYKKSDIEYEDLTSQVEMQTGFTLYSGNVYRIGKVVYVKLAIQGEVTTNDKNILKLPIVPKDNINSGCFLSTNLWATTHVGYMFISNTNGIITTKGSSTFSVVKYDFSYIIN